METTIILGLYRGHIRIMGNKMETTMVSARNLNPKA